MKKNGFVFLLVLTSVFGISLAACDSGNKASPQFKVSIDLNDIEEEFDTHTEVQNNYLNDNYENIDKYGTGSSENSKPNSLNLSWSIADSELELTALKLSLNENNEEPVTYVLDKDARNATITNLKVGTEYNWTITAVAGDKEVTSKPSFFKTKDGVARFISIDGLSNVRDCGGWTGLDGKKIKQGLLYRGEELNQQNNGRSGSGETATTDPSKVDPDDAKEREKEKPYGQKITETGINTFVNELKIKTEVDIRGYETFDYETRVNDHPTECGGLHDGRGIILDINYVINPVHTNRDKIYYDNYGKAACKKIFSMLADEKYLPVYFHCAQGKDRTGFLATLFQALLGCSKEDILRDYLLSNLGKTGQVTLSKLNNNYNYIDYFIDGKNVSPAGTATGDTAAERVYNYLLDCGLTTTQLDQIRAKFLED